MRARQFLASSRRIACALLALAAGAAGARDMRPLDDGELAAVRGADGLAFNLLNFSFSGPLSLTYSGPSGDSLALSNLSLSRSDDPDATFSDPYTLRVLKRGNGLADVIQLTDPANANGLLRWQFAADWRVQANGIDHQAGALLVTDLVSRGSSLTLTTPAEAGVEGVAFGLGLHLDIGAVSLRPRGRDDKTEQFQLGGIHLGAADGNGAMLGTPWALADATNQPGIFNAVTENGVSYLHLGLAWPTTSAGAPTGSLVIDNVSFTSSALAGGTMDLGSSRIGTMQIQYLDVKLRAQ